ncbi:hypothetical protein LG201_03595 [Methylobacillus gramineus]|uniref:hypothetical protein n=1 Tax=Methylobacillus gramineus TaxID=755169 RepID=UPI001CFFB133|nr:hypothetical protein [Methylobacillus gramineus]MCB5184283.1 hypothetical protein [Methylobacillus gramineus]
MKNNRNNAHISDNFLIIAIFNPRLEPYFVDHLTAKIRYEANDGISMVIDMARKEFSMLCHWKKIPIALTVN